MRPNHVFTMTLVACAIAAGIYMDYRDERRDSTWSGRVARSAIRKAQARARLVTRT